MIGMEGMVEWNEVQSVEKEMLCWGIKGLCRLITESKLKGIDMCVRLI